MRLVPPTLPAFGSGIPGAGVAHSDMYFDTDTTPYTPYIYSAGAWQQFGGSFSASEIQGVDVSATPPTDKQTLVYNAGSSEYVPGAV